METNNKTCDICGYHGHDTNITHHTVGGTKVLEVCRNCHIILHELKRDGIKQMQRINKARG